MPPKRRGYAGMKYGRAKRTRRPNAYGMVPSARRGYYRVRGRAAGALVMSPERKYFDATKASTNIAESTDWTGTEVDPTANSLFTPVLGTAINNRVGRKVAVHKIKIRGTIVPANNQDQADTLLQPNYRIILYQDKQTNGAQSQGEDVMAAPTTVATGNAFCSFQSLANFGRFRVLKDKIYTPQSPVANTDGANTTSQTATIVPFKMTVNFRKPVLVHFNALNGGTIADIVDNSFHLLAQGSSTQNGASILYESRVVYTDA